jgi:REP element-mobilizing transposase RayT
MARRPRLQYAGGIYHVMSRGNRRGAIYESDRDRHGFVATLASAATRYDLRVLAYCLMGNHYHLVCESPRGNLSDAMQFLNGVYAQAWNRHRGQSGHLFEARFRSLVIQRESYLRRAARYVVLNPVRAGISGDAASWPWSSYLATSGRRPAPSWLDLDWLDLAFPAPSRTDSTEQYRAYVSRPLARQARMDTEATVVGSKAFRAAVLAGRPDFLRPSAAPPPARPTLEACFASATSRYERDRTIERAHIRLGYSLAEIARHLGCDRSAASKALRRVTIQR